MKKLIISVVALAVCGSVMFAQDLKTATEAYNNGAVALSEDKKADALNAFKEALKIAQELGAEGEEIVGNCKTYIPTIQFSIAKETVNNAEYDKAIEELKSTIAIAKEYGQDKIADEVAELIPQVLMQKANTALNDKDYAAAAEGYKAVLAEDPANGTAALRLGSVLSAAGDKDGAIEAFNKAIENGQEKAATKQLSNLFLKEAAGCLKTKNYSGAVTAALESNKYIESAKAYQIAGQASQIQGKNSQAVEYFEKYLELAPTASNSGKIAFTIAAICHKQGNVAKAKEYYQKVVGDPAVGAQAKEQLAKLK